MQCTATGRRLGQLAILGRGKRNRGVATRDKGRLLFDSVPAFSSCCPVVSALKMDGTAPRVKQLLTPLRKSIIDKPPYVSGTLQLPASSFSLFYKTTKDDHASRFADHSFLAHPGEPPRLTCHHRHIDLAHASVDELEQLAQACEPTAFGVDDDHGSSVKASKMDVGRFAPVLAP